jgi:hypothetical protein
VIVDVDQPTAYYGASYYRVQAADGMPLQAIIAGRYHDRFELADGTWRFADRFIFVDLVGELSKHLRVQLALDSVSS